jgi:nucleoside-diphosphate-sugar epimerase
LGGSNLLPLTYVENCADAIVAAGAASNAAGQVYNVVDDDLPTSSQYLRLYRRNVTKMRSVRVPYFALKTLSRAVERYHRWSQGQLPAIFTEYKTASLWGGNRFSNERLKLIGWQQHVPTAEGMRRTFEAFRAETK